MKRFMHGDTRVVMQFDTETSMFHVYSRCQLGKTASQHIQAVTEAAKICIAEYRAFLKKTPTLTVEEDTNAEMFQVLVQHGINKDATTKEGLIKGGDELVKQGYLVSNTLLQDYLDSHPEYKDGDEISLGKIFQSISSHVPIDEQCRIRDLMTYWFGNDYDRSYDTPSRDRF